MSKKADIAKVLEQLLAGDTDLAEIKAELQALTDRLKKVEAKTAKVPVTQIQINNKKPVKLPSRMNPKLERVVKLATDRLHTYLIGPAGCGKTTLAEQVAKALELDFYSVCFTAGASEAWLFGRQTPTGFIEGPFSKAYRLGGLFLADEMDACDANLLLCINTALSHHVMMNPMNGEMITRHKDFVMIGSGNTRGKGANHVYSGRVALDASTRDRFVEVDVTYDQDLEKDLCPNQALYEMLQELRKKLIDGQQDDFVSTRAFVKCSIQMAAGADIADVMHSLGASWNDTAKEMLVKTLAEHSSVLGKQTKKSTVSTNFNTITLGEDDWELLK